MNAKYNSRKGRKLQKLVAEKILKTFRHLKKSDVQVAATGVNGPNLQLSRIAKRLCPVLSVRSDSIEYRGIKNVLGAA